MPTHNPIKLNRLLCGLTTCGLKAGVTFACAAIVMLESSASAQNERWTIQVASGRVFSGYLTARSDQRQIELVTGSDSALLIRPIEWSVITGLRMGDREVSPDEMRASLPETIATPHVETPPRVTLKTLTRLAPENLDDHPPSEPRPSRWPIRSVSFYAETANWDADAEDDGLRIHLQPRDARDDVIAVRGHLEVRLLSYRNRGPHRYGIGTHHEIVELGRWRVEVRDTDFGELDAIVQLPFQQLHPAHDLSLGDVGLVHLKLVVPGQGVFHSSRDGIRIRRYRPLSLWDRSPHAPP